MATITIDVDDEFMKEIEERAAKESRSAEDVAKELLQQSVKPYKLELQGWNHQSKLLVDVSDRNKLYEVLEDDEYMKKRGFRE
jgi:hypothetical protein